MSFGFARTSSNDRMLKSASVSIPLKEKRRLLRAYSIGLMNGRVRISMNAIWGTIIISEVMIAPPKRKLSKSRPK